MIADPSPKLFSTRKTLELIKRLQSTVNGFAERERKLNRGISIKTSTLKEEAARNLEAAQAKLEADLEAENMAFQTRLTAVETAGANRQAWIARAARNAKQSLHERITRIEGQGRYDLQRSQLLVGQQRETFLNAANQAYHEARAELAEDQERLATLEKRARTVFSGFPSFRRALGRARKREVANYPVNLDASLQERRAEFAQLAEGAAANLSPLEKSPAPAFYRMLPISLVNGLLILGGAAFFGAIYQMKLGNHLYPITGGALVVLLLLANIPHKLSQKRIAPQATDLALILGKARALLATRAKELTQHHEAEVARIGTEVELTSQEMAERSAQEMARAAQLRNSTPQKLEEKERRVIAKNKAQYAARLQPIQPAWDAATAKLNSDFTSEEARLKQELESGLAQAQEEFEEGWDNLISEWKHSLQGIYGTIDAANAAAAKLFPDWRPDFAANWSPPAEFANVAKFGELEVDVLKLCESLPQDPRLKLEHPAQFSVPLQLSIPDQGSLIIETKERGRDVGVATLNEVILRLLSVAPPGRLSFTIIDPVGLGENFAGVMHLADYEESLIHSKIWTQSSQIEQRLGELNEHMEKVIQMYLRNEYQSIAEYNEQAGNIAEKYHFLVVADFPAGFSEVAAKRLHSIATSGGRCGVYTLIHWDQRHALPQDVAGEDLRRSGVSIVRRDDDFVLSAALGEGTRLKLEAPPNPEDAMEFIHKVGKGSIDAGRVEVPFSYVAPKPEEIWSLDTTHELRVPIGRTGATKLQYLSIGKGTRQHALLAGKTGSGKSTLFHVMITNLSLWASPDQVEFYLIDFKKGVEFKAYATHRLPHAKVIAIESDREFGLSVLQRVDEELRRRGDLFRKLGAQDIAGYKKAGGTEAMPRCLLMIDEFQEFFVEDDRVSQNAAVLMDRIVRQGRAFGIHVILGSQTLGGAFTLARSTLGQMVIRIALQCNEADSYLIMDDGNPAARLLSRPGEGIYNDSAGALEGNNPFQVVWLSDDTREESLTEIQRRAQASGKTYGVPVVFEGNAPSEIRENSLLRDLLAAPSVTRPAAPRIWMGAPNSIKGPTEAVFQRQSGNHLLMVGQRDEAALSLLGVALISLSAQYPSGGIRFVVFDGTAPETPEREFLDRVLRAVPHPVTIGRHGEVEEIMQSLHAELKSRAENRDAVGTPVTFIFALGVQKFKKLRYEEDYNFSLDDSAPKQPGLIFNDIILEGASLGMHVFAVCDTYNNVVRSLSRKAIGEFEMRVLFQMSANDSASLIDSPKASTLGLNRAVLYNEQEGTVETFRPYAPPDDGWLDAAARALEARK